MQPFTEIEAIAIPVDISNCDTDQIIPARFLRRLPSDPEYHRFLFHDLRFDADGNEKPEFILNRDPFRAGKIIVADVNWGCGSSREGAVYALVASGIRAVVAPSFGDIHLSNCTKQGVLPVELPAAECDRLRSALHRAPGAHIRIDLRSQTLTGPEGDSHEFAISPAHRHRLLHGLDDIGMTLALEHELDAFEKHHFGEYDWMPR